MTRIIYTNSDDSVSVVYPVSGTATASLAAKAVPSGTAYQIVADSVIPTDDTFRDAWRRNGGAIEINLAAAKTVAHNAMRALAVEAIRVSQEKTSLGETPTFTPTQISTALLAAKNAVTADTTDADIKVEMNNFLTTYAV